MSFEFTIDDQTVSAEPGQTILEAADAAGVYIPRLCHHPRLSTFGACRVCTVFVNGRAQAACTQPATPGMLVDSETEAIVDVRKALVEMLLIEGNHVCPSCEKSGQCELQALGYRLGVTAPRYPFRFPRREVDASHPLVLLDHNRCVLCGRCVRSSHELDGKHVFDFVGRGIDKRVAVNARLSPQAEDGRTPQTTAGLGDTDLDVADAAVELCPVGAILNKRVAFRQPIGERRYDHEPIGSPRRE